MRSGLKTSSCAPKMPTSWDECLLGRIVVTVLPGGVLGVERRFALELVVVVHRCCYFVRRCSCMQRAIASPYTPRLLNVRQTHAAMEVPINTIRSVSRAVMSPSRGATAQLQLLLGLPSVLRAASKICTPPRSRREECRRTRCCAAEEWLGGGGDTRLETRERALVQGRKLHTKHTLLTGLPAAAASSTPASQQSALVWFLRDAPDSCPRMRP